MFISENTQVKDSAIFYAFLREALIEQVSDNADMKTFVENASDTDVISYAVIGKAAPSNLNSALYETALLSIIKESMLDNVEIFTESEEYKLSDFIQEIGSLQNISSQDILKEGISDGPLNTQLDKIVDPSVDKIADLSVIDKVTQGAKDIYKSASTGLTDLLKKAGDNVSSAWTKVSDYVSAHQKEGKAIGAAALIAAAGFISYKVYQNYYSKAAKACAGKKGAEKTACMTKAKAQASKARIASLRKGNSLANKSSNPVKVRASLNDKIKKLQK